MSLYWNKNVRLIDKERSKQVINGSVNYLLRRKLHTYGTSGGPLSAIAVVQSQGGNWRKHRVNVMKKKQTNFILNFVPKCGRSASIQIQQLMSATQIDQPPQANMPCTQKLTAIRTRYRKRIVVINSRLARIIKQEHVHTCVLQNFGMSSCNIIEISEAFVFITDSHMCTEFKSSTTLPHEKAQ